MRLQWVCRSTAAKLSAVSPHCSGAAPSWQATPPCTLAPAVHVAGSQPVSGAVWHMLAPKAAVLPARSAQ